MNSGYRIGPYEIERELGRGGMGVVFRARDPAGRLVAIKRIAVRDDELARRLVREAQVRIVHENVVRVLGAGLDQNGEPYVVTELLEGESLQDRLARGAGALDIAELVRLFAQAADGLAAIHAAGIVHRDIKPSNLFITTSGVLKVLDFGTAAFSDASTMTITGALLGTPAYFSPEQARGEPVDARSDLWALGMTMYQALTGELPFRRSSVVASALAVQLDPLPGVLEKAPSVPLELAVLVERCLARRREDRPRHAEELARSLRAIDTETTGRPSQPLLAPSEETWRSVAIAVVDGTADRDRVAALAAELGGVAFPVLARAAVVVFGAGTSRGDELERAIELALAVTEHGAGDDPGPSVVVGEARARAGGRELDSASLRVASEVLARSKGGVTLTPHAAAFASPYAKLEPQADGSARVIAMSRGSGGSAPTALVGRGSELAALEDAARRAAEGAFVHADVVGDPGIGKTALVRAFAERLPAIAHGAVSVFAHAGHTTSTPYAPLLDALGLTVPEGGDPQAMLDRRRVGVLDRLGELLVTSSLVVLVVEDVHDIDSHTAELLRELRVLFEHRPLLLVTTMRPPRAFEADDVVRLVLGPLGPSFIAALVEPILGSDEARRSAAELTSRTGGNPLFALHLAQLSKARRERSGDDDSSFDLPLTIESAVQAQLDGLSAELRGATHTMAVLGTEGTLAEARFALGSRADRWIAGLTAAGVLDPVHRSDRPGWQFKSRIVAEVALAALDPSAAARLHREIAGRFAAASDAGIPGAPDPDVVLRHADRGGDDALAARFVREAFFRAARIGDGRRVLDLLPRARSAADVPFAILIAAAEAAAFVGEGPGVEPLLRDALAHATTPDERALALAELGERARRAGDLSQARAHLERALAETTSDGIAARTRCRLALVRISEGDARGALVLAGTPVPDSLPVAIRALVAETRGYVHGARGELGPRCEAYEEAARLYADAGDARRAAGANANLGDSLRQLGDLAGAEVALRRAIDGARRVGNGLTEAYACTNLAATLTTLGRRREALATLEVAAARANAVGDRRLALIISLHRARAEARAPSEAALDEVKGRNDPTLSAMALAVLLEHGAPTETDLAEAAGLLERADDIEEGAVDIGRALYARVPSEALRASIVARIDRTYRTLHRASWRATYVSYVARSLGELAAPWVAAIGEQG